MVGESVTSWWSEEITFPAYDLSWQPMSNIAELVARVCIKCFIKLSKKQEGKQVRYDILRNCKYYVTYVFVVFWARNFKVTFINQKNFKRNMQPVLQII